LLPSNETTVEVYRMQTSVSQENTHALPFTSTDIPLVGAVFIMKIKYVSLFDLYINSVGLTT
jgi:hypothetical protein